MLRFRVRELVGELGIWELEAFTGVSKMSADPSEGELDKAHASN